MQPYEMCDDMQMQPYEMRDDMRDDMQMQQGMQNADERNVE